MGAPSQRARNTDGDACLSWIAALPNLKKFPGTSG